MARQTNRMEKTQGARDQEVVHFFGDRERNKADTDKTERMLDQLIAEEVEDHEMTQRKTEETELVFVPESEESTVEAELAPPFAEKAGMFLGHVVSFFSQRDAADQKTSHNLKDASYIASSHYSEEEDAEFAEGYTPQESAEDAVDYQEDVRLEEEESTFMDAHPEDVLVRWEGPEYEVYPQSRQWYIVMGLLLALIVSYAIFTNSPVMAILFVLVGVVGYLYMTRAPRVVNFGVTEEGIAIGDQMIAYDEIRSFWIIYEPPHTRVISLHMQGRFLPYIHIPLHQVDPVDVHEALTEYIPEVRQEPNLVDALERVLGI